MINSCSFVELTLSIVLELLLSFMKKRSIGLDMKNYMSYNVQTSCTLYRAYECLRKWMATNFVSVINYILSRTNQLVVHTLAIQHIPFSSLPFMYNQIHCWHNQVGDIRQSYQYVARRLNICLSWCPGLCPVCWCWFHKTLNRLFMY